MKGYKTWIIPFLILFSVLFIPDFKFSPSLPKFRAEDFFLPFLIFILLPFKRNILKINYFILIMATAGWAIITILANRELNKYNDWFEIYKLFKFAIYFLYFYFFLTVHDAKKMVTILFFPLLLFNLLHFFNLWDFNKVVMPIYRESQHLSFFGLDSMGNQATKRMLGTAGNPNDNSLIFLFFLSFLMPIHKKIKVGELILFLVCFTAVVLCQSRTGFLAGLFIILVNLFSIRPQIKYAALQLGGVLLLLAIINRTNFHDLTFSEPGTKGGTNYLNSLSHSEVVHTKSVEGRLEVWKHMWDMVKSKLLLGHGPYKNYFYDKNLYPEGQYLLWLWRYGIPGFLLHLAFFVYPLVHYIRRVGWRIQNPAALFLIAISIGGLTNTPLHNRLIMILIAAAVALVLNGSHERKTESVK